VAEEKKETKEKTEKDEKEGEEEEEGKGEDNSSIGNLSSPEGIVMLCVAGFFDLMDLIPFINAVSDIIALIIIGGWMLTKQSGRKKIFARLFTVFVINLMPVVSSFTSVIGILNFLEISPGKSAIPPISWLGHVYTTLKDG